MDQQQRHEHAPSHPGPASHSQFHTTRWSVVLAAADPTSPASADALATLCSTYWYPLYAYARRRGHPPERAEDLTQEFFSRLLEKQFLEGVSREEGKRFRSFLLVCLKRFLANEWERASARKRGGGQRIVSIDRDDAEGRYQLEPVDHTTPERMYERRWALTVLERALTTLGREMEASGRSALFELLRPGLAGELASGYAAIAAELGMTEGAVKVAAHRLRQRYAAILREEIAGTLADPAEIDAEIQALFDALGT